MIEIATGDTIIPQAATVSQGASGGRAYTYPTAGHGSPLDCRVDTLSASEAREYAARGQRRTHNVFFASDPGLSNPNGYRFKWTTTDGNTRTLSPALYLRVHAIEYENSPDGDLQLWIAICEWESTREDA